ncbi:MAG: hypothetical protein JRH18_18645 [Deltaproteobacteria bacterium]|nr:hypothetical protein [Deltaproteobacteria bacterium]MBW1993162.1 hypothetical protein [Deltaproteobacteria bacterium]MBW2153675.1 hypothetical protein [Deltaproteobacteria bacterium]
MAADWKETGWNGIRFMAPAGWEPVEIGKRYLLLQDETGPVVEIKWGAIKGSFSHKTQLRDIYHLLKKQSITDSGEIPLPPLWLESLKSYEASGFAWSGQNVSGKGVMLFCAECGNATLIQFYNRKLEKSDEIACRLLASFMDHPANGKSTWSIFDVRAQIPEQFNLIQHRFSPGEYRISLSDGLLNVTLYRWAPASVLLSGKKLEQFAKAMGFISDNNPIYLIEESKDMLEWQSGSSPLSGWSGWWQRITRRCSVMRFRIWHETDKNRILAIQIKGNKWSELNILDAIASSYESI